MTPWCSTETHTTKTSLIFFFCNVCFLLVITDGIKNSTFSSAELSKKKKHFWGFKGSEAIRSKTPYVFGNVCTHRIPTWQTCYVSQARTENARDCGGTRGTIPISLRGVILWSVLETLGETKSLIVWKKTGKKRNMYLWSWFWSISFFLVRLFVTYDCDVEAKCLISGEEAVYHPVAFLLQVGNVRRSTWFNAITLSLPFSDTAFIIL